MKETNLMAFIEIRNLFKRYKKVTAVNRIQLEVEEGEFLTLLGPSGCGKTTTLRCIAGLEKPEKGEIIVGGEIYYSTEKRIFIAPDKRNIGMVFQSYAVWPHMNVFNNVAYGLRRKNVRREEIKKKVEWAIELVGLQGLAERQGTKLGGGHQQGA